MDSTEFSQLPVRHNEDLINTDLAKTCPLEVNAYTMDSPHTKAHLLLQCHLSRLPLPCTDYVTDTKSVMDNALRVMQAMLDVCAESGWLASTLRIVMLLQSVVQARWDTDPGLLLLPHLEPHMLPALGAASLPELLAKVGDSYEVLARPLRNELTEQQIEEIWSTMGRLPLLGVSIVVGEETIRRPTKRPSARAADQQWIKVQTGVQVKIKRRFNTYILNHGVTVPGVGIFLLFFIINYCSLFICLFFGYPFHSAVYLPIYYFKYSIGTGE